MAFRSLLVGLALAPTATDLAALPPPAQVQPFVPVQQPVYLPAPYSPGVVLPAGGVVTGPAPAVPSPVVTVSGYTPAATPTVTPAGVPGAGIAPAGGLAGDGLDEVNAKRAARGLRPFLRDEGLMQAARACAQHRAAHGQAGHTSNDFAFVPAGSFATSAGCAAAESSWGWLSCCTYDNFTYAGAAWVMGRDGQRYMHLFVR